jgi:uncharacterized protein (TIGR02996 family)
MRLPRRDHEIHEHAMSDEGAFLRAICENPDEDTPRLVFADWLDEHDRPERAELIRVQCERARELGARERRTHLLKRSMQLIQEFGQGWYNRDWPDAGENAVTGYTFDRGFVDTVSLSRRELRDADVIRVIRTRPLLALVRSLNISMNHIGDGGLRALAECPRLARLRCLILTANPFTLRGVEALAAAPHLTSLAELRVGHWINPDAPGTVLSFLESQMLSRQAQELFRRHGRSVRVLT